MPRGFEADIIITTDAESAGQVVLGQTPLGMG
jgi:hypothetical protein